VSPASTCAVPGDVTRVRQLAEELLTMGVGLRDAVTVVTGTSVAGWTGPAAAAFVRLTQIDPEPYVRAARALSAAGEAVLAHAAVLAGAQRLAAEAAALSAVAPPDDPGRPQREHAADLLDLARSRVRRSGAQTAAALRQAAAIAPDRPGFVVRQLSALRSFGEELAVGVAQGASGLVLLAERLAPQSLLLDPRGYWRDEVAAATGVLGAVGHPLRTWDDAMAALREHPTRTVGSGLPTVAIGVVSGGSGAVALRGASLGARIQLHRLPGLPPGAARTVVRSVRDGHGSPIRSPDLQPYLGQAHAGGDAVRLSALDHAVANVVLRDAAAAEPRITPRVRGVASRLGAELLKPQHALKGPDSLKRKLATDLAPPGRESGEVGRALGDSVRYAVAVPDQEYAVRTVQSVGLMRAQGFRLAAAKARWTDPGYRGTNLTFRDRRSGRLLELQVHTGRSWSANLATHEDYEVARDLTRTAAERAEASGRIQGEYARVPIPAGAAHLQARLNLLGRDVEQRSVRPPLLRLPEVRAGAAGGGALGGGLGGALDSTPGPGWDGGPRMDLGARPAARAPAGRADEGR